MTEKLRWEGPSLDAWQPWTPTEVSRRLVGLTVPWCVVGGWAIDLFLGRETRKHEDLEIAIPRIFFQNVRPYFQTFGLYAVGDGENFELGDCDSLPADKFQCWVLDREVGKWRLDVMSEPGDSEFWRFRRDERIEMSRSKVMKQAPNGIPYLAPEAVLLFKAAARPKDQTDFSNILPRLSVEARQWLRDSLALAHPNHAWLEELK